MALLLLIVSRSEPSRFTYLEHVFFANETVDVILDRRVEERRRRDARLAAERRHEDRRQRDIAEDLRRDGWSLLRRER